MKNLVFFLICLVAVSACAKSPSPQQEAQVEVNQQNNAELERSYKQKIEQIVDRYRQEGVTQELQQQLLATKTPAGYLEFHLQLAILFDRIIKEGQDDARQELEELLSETSWL